MNDTYTNFWEWIFVQTPHAENYTLIACLLVGIVVGANPWTWDKLKLAATWVHEAGHAIVALMTGRSVSGIKVNADASGVTNHVGRSDGLGRILTAFAGYPAPVIVAYGIVVGVMADKYHLVVAAMILFVAILFPLHRNIRGFWWAFLFLCYSVLLVYLPPTVGQASLFLLAGFLVVATPRTIIELHRARKQQKQMLPSGEPVHSDADTLSGMTAIPAIVWELVFFVVTGVFCWWMASAFLA